MGLSAGPVPPRVDASVKTGLRATVDQLTDLVGSAEVADTWDRASALPGMTVGGLARRKARSRSSKVCVMGSGVAWSNDAS